MAAGTFVTFTVAGEQQPARMATGNFRELYLENAVARPGNQGSQVGISPGSGRGPRGSNQAKKDSVSGSRSNLLSS